MHPPPFSWLFVLYHHLHPPRTPRLKGRSALQWRSLDRVGEADKPCQRSTKRQARPVGNGNLEIQGGAEPFACWTNVVRCIPVNTSLAKVHISDECRPCLMLAQHPTAKRMFQNPLVTAPDALRHMTGSASPFFIVPDPSGRNTTRPANAPGQRHSSLDLNLVSRVSARLYIG